jgi:hypothetical protein
VGEALVRHGRGCSRFDPVRTKREQYCEERQPRALSVGDPPAQWRRIAPHHEKLLRKVVLEAAAEMQGLLQIPNAEPGARDYPTNSRNARSSA